MYIGGSDFAPVLFLGLSFPRLNTSSVQSSQITIIDDGMVEDQQETFQVNMTSTDPRVTVIVTNNIVTIVDDDGKGVLCQVELKIFSDVTG